MKIEDRLKKIPLETQVRLGSGADFWHTKGFEMYGIDPVMMCDGPHGLRKQEGEADMLGINRSVPATCFPTASLTACSWDTSLLGRIGEAIGKEANSQGIGVVLGPGVNIKRNPLCGRNFEYFSEDPFLSGKLAASFIEKAEGTGAGTSLKHFALNNQEFRRFYSDSVVDERTLREIYLTAFEIAVKEGRPSTVMCAYNKINGTYCSDNQKLLTEILREEWGFDGLVMTDWGAINDRILGYQAGCDLSMPGGSAYMEEECIKAVLQGELSAECVARSAARVIKLAEKVQNNQVQNTEIDMEQHYDLARVAAEESAVLLKNDHHFLPLQEADHIAVIGLMAKEMRIQGAGSSHINPWKTESFLDLVHNCAYSQGYDAAGSTTPEQISEALKTAENADKIILFAGLPANYESEGSDRKNMKLPEGQNRLIEEVSKVNSNIAVVLMSGSAVEIPWKNLVKSILYVGLPGEAGGAAIRNLLWGHCVPSGKLAETWPVQYEDCVSSSYFGEWDAHYREGVYVGYRYYATAEVKTAFPFGFGLSYTDFSYSDIRLENNQVLCSVKNNGNLPAKEIAQLYISKPDSNFYRPVRELKGFCKLAINPGETATAVFDLSDRSFAIWNVGWYIEPGTYEIRVGGSSENLPLCIEIHREVSVSSSMEQTVSEWYRAPKGHPSDLDFESLIGHTVQPHPKALKGQFTMQNSILEMKEHSFVMKLMYKMIEKTIAKGYGGVVNYHDPDFAMMVTASTDAPLRSMKINGGMKNHMLEGLVDMANGHFFQGLLQMLRK